MPCGHQETTIHTHFYKADAASSGVQPLAQRHFNMQSTSTQNQTRDLKVTVLQNCPEMGNTFALCRVLR